MTREISKFKGKCLILGKGWAELRPGAVFFKMMGEPQLDKEQFYTVDISSEAEPDGVYDFTENALWDELPDSSMDFILFEHVPFLENIQVALNECHRVLSPKGVAFYRGGCDDQSSILDLFSKAGFTQSASYASNNVPINQELLKNLAKGMFSFASKNDNLLTQSFLNENLPTEALELIRWYIFMDVTYPKNYTAPKLLELVKQDSSKNYLSEITFYSNFELLPPETKKLPTSTRPAFFTVKNITPIVLAIGIFLAATECEWGVIAFVMTIPYACLFANNRSCRSASKSSSAISTPVLFNKINEISERKEEPVKFHVSL